ncbi:M24 family metallopeptidase [Anaeroselena agilis]|uniref:M24 family metallopeptidase n=1 Tax=Anaeroselena agilis TaxID=3063788 RepID=A0ABU3NUP1_9FIRM|nr:M24 family metallopeptidase [Selenomonadales bacterium 4137-cl]
MNRSEEVDTKHRRLAAMMAANGYSAVLLKKQPNFSWFTAGGRNMVGMATELGVASLLVTREARYCIANRIEAARMMDEEGLAGLGFELLEYGWHEDREAELVARVAGGLGSVAADTDFASCRNADGEIRKLRYSLTESEIERYLFLGAKLSAAIEKVMFSIRPGDRECEIAGRIGPELWKDLIDPTAIMVAADERIYRYRHPIATDRTVKRYVMVALNARYKGLITAVTRMLHFGRPDAKLAKQFRDNNEVECRMIAATKPGSPAVAAFDAALAAYREFGFADEWLLHHQGGAMGYYGRDYKVTAGTTEIVAENQAFCWNPTITGTKTEDAFIATAGGPLMITGPVSYPRIASSVGGVDFVRPGLLVID